MKKCRDCAYLKEVHVSEICSYLQCVKPQGNGNKKASKGVGGCEYWTSANGNEINRKKIYHGTKRLHNRRTQSRTQKKS